MSASCQASLVFLILHHAKLNYDKDKSFQSVTPHREKTHILRIQALSSAHFMWNTIMPKYFGRAYLFNPISPNNKTFFNYLDINIYRYRVIFIMKTRFKSKDVKRITRHNDQEIY